MPPRLPSFLKLLALTLVIVTGLVAAESPAPPAPKYFILEIEARSERTTLVELFYDTGYGYSGMERASITLPAGGSWQILRMKLPPAPLKRLRLDPSDTDVPVEFRRIRLLADTGQLVKVIDPGRLRPTNQIESITPTADGVMIRPIPGATDPTLLVDESLHEIMHRWMGLAVLGRGPLAAFGLATLLLGLIAAGIAGSRALDASGLPCRQAGLVLVGSFFIVWGARLAFLLHYSRPMPYWDEWSSDGLYLLAPLHGGFLDWQALFIPQNEHRIVIERLITLLGTMANGEWDPRIAMVAGAALFAGAVALLNTVLQAAGRWPGLVGALILALLTAMPFDPANFLWGGQVQMYALVFFCTCVVVIAASRETGPLTALGAGAAGLMTLGTMGSGFVAPGVAAIVCGWRAGLEPARRRELWRLALIFAVCAGLGLAWREDSRWLAPTYAHSLGEFFRALVAFASWPLSAHLACAILLWFPWIFHVASLFSRREKTPLDWFCLGLGAWAAINLVGVARARPDVQIVNDARYFTTFSLTVIAGVASLAALQARQRRGWHWLLALPVAAGVIGLGSVGLRGINQLQAIVPYANAHDSLVRGYLASGDRSHLVNPPPGSSPYWNSQELGVILDSPHLQPLLPAPLRKALNSRPGAVAVDTQPGPLTLAARSLMKAGIVLFAIGPGLFVLFAWQSRPGKPGAAATEARNFNR